MKDRLIYDMTVKLEHLIAGLDVRRPDVQAARQLTRRARFVTRRHLLENSPRTRRYLLADLRAAAKQIERNTHEHAA